MRTWTRRPPGPRGLPGLGSAIAFHRDPNGFLLRLATRYGDISRFTVAGREFYLLNHPDLIKELLINRGAGLRKGRLIQRAKRFLGEGLITSEEPRHLAQRRKLQRNFRDDRMHRAADLATWSMSGRLAGWGAGDTIDIEEEMRRVMLAIVGGALFDTHTENDVVGMSAVLRTLERGYPLLMLPSWVEQLPFPPLRRLQHARRALDERIHRLIAARRRCPNGDDVITDLLRAGPLEGTGCPLDRQIRDEVVTLFVAGHETTTNMLCWALHLVSTHPHVERAVLAEIEQALGGRAPNSSDIPKLRYAAMILSETLRLYPPVGRLGRRSGTDIRIGSYLIPAGAVMFVSPYVMHRDARFFPNPSRFEPERWTREACALRPRFSYIPYGAGSRMCIGAHFAQTVGIAVLATLLPQWRLVPATDRQPVPRRMLTIAPKGGLPMVVRRREMASAAIRAS